MKRFTLQRRTLALLAVIVPLLVLFAYVALRSGPLAPVAVTVVTVESRAIAPALFGIGTVDARYTYKIGPTLAGRVQRLDVHVGDVVKAGQPLARIVNAFGRRLETMTAAEDGIVLGHSDSSVAFPGVPVMAFGIAET